MRLRTILGGCVGLVTLTAAVLVVVLWSGGRSPQGMIPASDTTAAGSTGATGSTGSTATTKLTELPHATVADGTAPLVLRLSGPVAPRSPTPLLSPAAAGRWTVKGDLETFTPASTLEPCTTYQLTVWSQTAATGQLPLGTRRVLTLAVACPGVRAVQQALARLHYLPYSFHSRTPTRGRETRGAAAHAAFRPPAGHFVKVIRQAPPLAAGQPDATTRGALEVFQETHGSAPTGTATAATWAALLGAEAGGNTDRTPYTFVTVSQVQPETLEVHRGNRIALKSATNTGVQGATTANGVFPIYERFVSTTMTGTNPDGSHYSDPGVPWVNYFNGGDAVHGFDRPGYGYPQSDGCVELPPATAAVVFKMLAIGDIVVVSG
ncbi:MAG TPA: L,D-transpeptidase [Solirubrobacteraceae bacterium]|nr:L,D-transpeptidase [Solirubrobacteraceae bacterium]